MDARIKAPEGWRSPKRKRVRWDHRNIRQVLDCGGPPPLFPDYPRFTGSMSTARVTSSGRASVAMIFVRAWLNLLIAFVRNMIW